MARVLVTGGTGMLGRRLVPLLVDRGHDVRVVARHVATVVGGAQFMRGDVRTGQGLGDAADDVDTVVHAATNPRRGVRKTEVLGIRNVLDAIQRSRPHLVYVSIVGAVAIDSATTRRSGRRSRSSSRARCRGRSSEPPSSTTCSTSS